MRKHQSGSAIIMLFIAAALFGALAYAFMQGSRTSTGVLTDEQSKTYAQQIIAYANNVSTAVKRLSLRGCKDVQISMQNASGNYVNPSAPTTNQCHTFNVAGGGIQNNTVPAEWLSTAPTSFNPWFNGEIAVQDIGTTKAELIMWITNVKPDICAKLNSMLGINSMSTEPMGGIPTAFVGTYASSPDTIGDVAGSPYKGKNYACWNNSFFYVLLAR